MLAIWLMFILVVHEPFGREPESWEVKFVLIALLACLAYDVSMLHYLWTR